MNRRVFLKSTATFGAVVTLSPSLLLLEGCNVNVTQLLNTVLASAESILTVTLPNTVWVGDFQNAIAALQQAEKAWQGGSAINVVISALNTLEAVTAVIPLTAAYSPLIDVLVTGIEAVLSIIFQQNPGTLPTTPTATQPNPHRGRVTLQGKPSVGAYKKLFNTTAKNCGLPTAAIK